MIGCRNRNGGKCRNQPAIGYFANVPVDRKEERVAYPPLSTLNLLVLPKSGGLALRSCQSAHVGAKIGQRVIEDLDQILAVVGKRTRILLVVLVVVSAL